MILQSSFHQKLWNPEYFSILWSGIDSFEWEKEYYSTSSIQWTNIIAPEEIITYENRPSRANMQPIIWAVWFAKMAKTLKVIKIDEEFAEKSIFSTWFALIYGNPDSIDSGYLKYFFLSSDFNSQKDRLSTGTTQVAINQKGIEKIEIPLFDIETQHLIVSEIEKQFSRLDEWLSSLLRIRANLKSYRASLLKSAVEWRLTEEWRRENPDIESAEKLLDRIRTVRREKWLSENLGKKYKEPERIDEWIDDAQLPEKWKFSRVEEISDTMFDWPFGSHLTSRDYVVEWVQVIRLENIEEMEFNRDKTAFISLEKYETLKRHTLQTNDIIFSSFVWDNIKACLLPELEFISINKADCFCIRFWHDLIVKKYLLFSLSNHWMKKQIQKISHWITRVRINLWQLRSLIINIPPLLEQHRIVEILEEKFTVIDSLESLVNTNIRRAENLKQAILKKAFSGELVWENH